MTYPMPGVSLRWYKEFFNAVMWTLSIKNSFIIAGIREKYNPTIAAVATMMIVVSVLLLVTVELLRRRNERLRGISDEG